MLIWMFEFLMGRGGHGKGGGERGGGRDGGRVM